jgi:predicted metalloprotease with PDZ domain
MNKLFYKILIFIAILTMTATTQAQNTSNIKFTVSFSEAQAHYADVKMDISNIKSESISVKMPVWTPGSYLIREFEKNVESFVATGTNKEISSEKTSKNTWKINTKGLNKISVTYRVYCFEVSVRTSFVDENHAFLSSTGIFMYVDGRLNESSLITIVPHQRWSKVSTGLSKVDGEKFTYYAQNFDWLYDSPIEVGNQDVFEFTAAGVKHDVAMVGGGNYDKERLKKDMAKIVEKETAIFGENPNKYYVFIVHHYQSGGGGLEHQNSTVLGASRNGYDNEKSYTSFLSLVAHEYFHLWNVKRLRPIALGPFNYNEENYTTNLWIAEGFTAYYDNLVTQRINAISPDDFLNIVQSDLNAVDNAKGSKIQSVSMSSFDAWIKYYRPDENSGNTTISYYNKGSLIACLIDLAIINNSKGAQSLDDAMKYAYNEFYKQKGRGYTDAEMKAVFEKFTGKNLDQFYKDYVYGTVSLDVNSYLNYAGLKLVDKTKNNNQPYLGATFSRSNKAEVATVSRGTSAWEAGLNVKDEVLAINGLRVTDVLTALADLDSSKEADFLINRDGILKTLKVKFIPSASKSMQIQQIENATTDQKTVLKKWLSL